MLLSKLSLFVKLDEIVFYFFSFNEKKEDKTNGTQTQINDMMIDRESIQNKNNQQKLIKESIKYLFSLKNKQKNYKIYYVQSKIS